MQVECIGARVSARVPNLRDWLLCCECARCARACACECFSKRECGNTLFAPLDSKVDFGRVVLWVKVGLEGFAATVHASFVAGDSVAAAAVRACVYDVKAYGGVIGTVSMHGVRACVC